MSHLLSLSKGTHALFTLMRYALKAEIHTWMAAAPQGFLEAPRRLSSYLRT